METSQRAHFLICRSGQKALHLVFSHQGGSEPYILQWRGTTEGTLSHSIYNRGTIQGILARVLATIRALYYIPASLRAAQRHFITFYLPQGHLEGILSHFCPNGTLQGLSSHITNCYSTLMGTLSHFIYCKDSLEDTLSCVIHQNHTLEHYKSPSNLTFLLFNPGVC